MQWLYSLPEFFTSFRVLILSCNSLLCTLVLALSMWIIWPMIFYKILFKLDQRWGLSFVNGMGRCLNQASRSWETCWQSDSTVPQKTRHMKEPSPEYEERYGNPVWSDSWFFPPKRKKYFPGAIPPYLPYTELCFSGPLRCLLHQSSQSFYLVMRI